MLDALTNRFSRVIKNLRGEARLTEANIQDAMREVRMALLEADVALPVVRDFVARVRESALGQEVAGSLTPGQAAVGVVYNELVRLMGEKNDALNLAGQPTENQMAGRQGAAIAAKYVSKWDGAKLVTTITSEGPNGPITRTETRWLEGSTLVVETNRTGRDGSPMTTKLVYKKTT